MDKVITTFGSGLLPSGEQIYNAIVEIGKHIAENNYIACTGGYAGTMEAISKGAKAAGGTTYGITVSSWTSVPNKYIDEETKMPNPAERLMELIALGDAYIIFRGGTGTLVEISLTLELMNKNMMKEKPLFFFTDFWRSTIDTLTIDSERVKGIIERNVQFFKKPDDIVRLIQSPVFFTAPKKSKPNSIVK
jgi:uncharacterized protein (TIGR00725 family)